MKKIIAITGFMSIFATSLLTASAGYFNPAPVSVCSDTITRTLRVGSRNNEVVALQNFLHQEGYLYAIPNGYFGNQTMQAVSAFQAENGILVTGTVGAYTREAVNNALCGNVGTSFDPSLYAQGVTFVQGSDPFVTVINPPVTNPALYATPKSSSYTVTTTGGVMTPSIAHTLDGQVASHIVYNPASGYTYGVVPNSGSVTVSSPSAQAFYYEGDSVYVAWTTNNLSPSTFSVMLESSISGQSKLVGVTQGNTYSFILTKELLDSVCSGTCTNFQKGSFKVVVTTPTIDIAGNVSTLRATVAPITISRPITYTSFALTGSKNPVNSGEAFKLYFTIPSTSPFGEALPEMYKVASVRIVALCPSGVSSSIAGVACGQEFILPSTVSTQEQQIPVVITNTTWYKQDVTYRITVTNYANQVIGSAETKVTVNGLPFSF